MRRAPFAVLLLWAPPALAWKLPDEHVQDTTPWAPNFVRDGRSLSSGNSYGVVGVACSGTCARGLENRGGHCDCDGGPLSIDPSCDCDDAICEHKVCGVNPNSLDGGCDCDDFYLRTSCDCDNGFCTGTCAAGGDDPIGSCDCDDSHPGSCDCDFGMCAGICSRAGDNPLGRCDCDEGSHSGCDCDGGYLY